jgi:L-galactose dehydrogenase/L-glyceraldehyde 3-phosphate reductase
MQYRTMGKNGPSVSLLGFGCGAIGGLLTKGDPTEQRRTVARALEAGITYFDTAQAYGNGRSEETIGPLLRELNAKVVLGTKFRLDKEQVPNAAAVIRECLEGSLKRLGQDSVDLFNLHNRIGYDVSGSQGALSVEDVLGPVAEGLAKVREAGLTRMIGITGLGETAAIHKVVASGLYDSVQTYVNAINPSAGWKLEGDSRGQNFDRLLDTEQQHGVGAVGIRVLAAGALALTSIPNRHSNAGDPGGALTQGGTYTTDLDRAVRLQALAAEFGLESPAELSYRLVIAHPGLSTALVGASELAHFEDALRWVERGPLDAAQIEQVLAAVA